jgi:O-antigen ligase
VTSARFPLDRVSRPSLPSRPDRASAISALALLFGVLAVFAAVQKPLLVIGGLCGLGFLALAHRAPVIALALFEAMLFLEQILVDVSGGALTPAIKGAGACLVLVLLLRVLSRTERVPFPPAVRWFSFAAAALVVWALAASLWAAEAHSAFSGGLRLAQGPLLMLVVVAFVRTSRDVALLAYVYVAGAAISALAGLTGVTQLTGSGSGDAGGRLSGALGDANFFAAVMMPAVTLGLFLALAPSRGRLFRVLVLAAGALALVAVFLSGSRGGVVALAVTGVVAVVFAGRYRAQILGLALVVAAVGGTYVLLFAPPETLSRITHLSAGGGTGRTDLWAVARNVYRSHPVAGVGLDNFQIVSPIYTVETNTDLPRVDVVVTQKAPVHNTYLQIAAELGTVGIVLLLTVLAIVLDAARRGVRVAARVGGETLELAGRGLVVGAVGMLAAFVFLSAEYEKQLWLVLGLLLAYACVARGDDERQAV